MRQTKKNNPVIVALDFDHRSEAVDLIEKLDQSVSYYKIGMQLFFREGNSLVREIKSSFRKSIFLDIKLNDIPNTIEKAVSGLSPLQPDMMTVFTGADGVKAAVEAADKKIKILNVTVLTSEPQESQTIDNVLKRTQLSLKNGANGVVCSGRETSAIRKEFGDDFIIVNPGIRMRAADDDQKRVVTPNEAVQNGATYLVIGRPITRAGDPARAALEIIDSIE